MRCNPSFGSVRGVATRLGSIGLQATWVGLVSLGLLLAMPSTGPASGPPVDDRYSSNGPATGFVMPASTTAKSTAQDDPSLIPPTGLIPPNAMRPVPITAPAADYSSADYPSVEQPAAAETAPPPQIPPTPPADAAAAAAAASVEPTEPSSPALSVAAVEALRAESAGATLSDEVRAQLDEHLNRAIERIQEANKFATLTAKLRQESAGAAEEMERLQATAMATKEPIAALPTNLAERTADEIRSAMQAAEVTHGEFRGRVQSLTAEIDRRAARLGQLPELLSQTRTKLEDVGKQLAALPLAGDPSEVVPARRIRLEATQLALQREVDSLQQETRTYGESTRLMSLRRDVAERSLKAAQRQLTELQRALAERERRDAERRAAAARRAAITAHPTVRDAAKVNSELAETNSRLVAAMETIRNDLVKAEAASEELGSQYLDTQKRAEAAQFSQAIGLMLRSQRAELPDTEYYRERARKRKHEDSELNFKLLEWETERRKIIDTAAVVEKNLGMVSEQLGLIEQVDVANELNEVFTARLHLYAELIANARNRLGRMRELQAAEDKLMTVIDGHATFISEHILWVRSTAPLSPSLIPPTVTAIGETLSPRAWLDVFEKLTGDVKSHPIFQLLIIPPVWLLITRRRLWERLEALSHDALRSSATGLQPTFQTILCTALLAIPVPALLALFGWRLTEAATVGEFSYALGKATCVTALAWALLNFIRHACQPNGLAESHFGWGEECTAAIRRATAMAKVTCLPASFICLYSQYTGDELLISTVGRLALIFESLALATIAFELLRGSSPIAAAIHAAEDRAWASHTYRIWASALVLAPIVLAFVSSIGYHYTATRLSIRVVATWGVIALLIGLRAVALRWLFVVYRRFAIHRSREKRAALALAREAVGGEGGDVSVSGGNPLEPKLSDVNVQAQRLIRIAATVIGAALLTLVWREILPAIGYLDRFTFWENGVLPVDDQGESPMVSLLDLLVGVAMMTITFLACRNLPGLLDITILQRLPLDPGARYAASAITQYLLFVIGVAVAFRQIGIGWQSVQWLIAAMTVGLGFGLQEIFANFVSGIILLFERPIRVGDTVTIGNVSGTVTRIRIRATTVLDWDNKELIVPNRDFVTGNLVNWTLSNPNLRVVIHVGIAYGSDTRLATRLLQEVAAAHPLTLPDPTPVVVFSSFGASSLDFELRVFASGLANSRILRHELHMAIDDAFREHKIEIAFPQQDLHVRSLPTSLVDQMSLTAASEAAGKQQSADSDSSRKQVA